MKKKKKEKKKNALTTLPPYSPSIARAQIHRDESRRFIKNEPEVSDELY